MVLEDKTIMKILGLTSFIFISIFIFRDWFRKNDLKYHKVITNAKVLNYSSNYRSNNSIKYTFIIEDKKITSSKGMPEFSRNACEELIGKEFPVAYSPEDPSINILLITDEDFESIDSTLERY